MKPTRREFVTGACALVLSGCSQAAAPVKASTTDKVELGQFQTRLHDIEKASGGTLGVELLDIATRASIGLNQTQRFGHASSFKLSLAAMVLARDSAGIDDADRHVRWSEDDLMFVSPFTTQEISKGASLRELARATQITSDNAAAILSF